jgi:hypothetical protein
MGEELVMKQSLGGMSPAFDYHYGVKPLASQAGGKVPTTHLWTLHWEVSSTISFLILKQASFKLEKMKPTQA